MDFDYLLVRPEAPTHDATLSTGSDLGVIMRLLYSFGDGDDPRTLNLISSLQRLTGTDVALSAFVEQYRVYKQLKAERDAWIEDRQGCCSSLAPIQALAECNYRFWGSYQQLTAGTCVVKHLPGNLHPVWGCLLNPTGGLPGPGNTVLMPAPWGTPLSFHSCTHDAHGYLYNYHGLGPGYNYLQTWLTFFPTRSVFSCQGAGFAYWTHRLVAGESLSPKAT